ncbi:ABC transporter substrate-binding protein [Pseudoroseomonas cervicalis]|uniref:ABC transporter substrate-binding protein n=1 Tax=Teichococcus cervicalis TaxID=204525 RepID=UPI002781D302|nr:ABC transporter substrate-binding protein [Pseudoroseomonas cervicalis]MDQ1077903.1 iron complex transport system substrate-binding protein [Pseudoroseomonas cervicalis]
MSPRGSDIRRRRLLAAGLAVPLLARPGLLRAAEGAPVTVTDLLGRRVSLPRPPRRIVLAQGRLLGTMGLLHPDPVALLAGRASDMAQALPDEEAAWTARFPALRGVPQLGRRILADMSVESVLALQPDLVLLTRGAIAPLDARGGSEVLARLERLGLTAVVVDFMADPLAETLPSLAILGALLDRRDQAAALSALYRARLAALDALRATRPAVPVPVLLHNNAGGRDCCYSIAHGSFADFLARMGGRSIAADLLPGALGQLHRETVLVSDAPVYLATGGVYNGRGGVSLGAGISASAARGEPRRHAAGPGAGRAALGAGGAGACAVARLQRDAAAPRRAGGAGRLAAPGAGPAPVAGGAAGAHQPRFRGAADAGSLLDQPGLR